MPIAMVQTLDAQNLWIHADHGDYLFCQLRHYPTGVCEDCDAHAFGCQHAPYVSIKRDEAEYVIFETHEFLTRIERQLHGRDGEYWTWRGTQMRTPKALEVARSWRWPEAAVPAPVAYGDRVAAWLRRSWRRLVWRG